MDALKVNANQITLQTQGFMLLKQALNKASCLDLKNKLIKRLGELMHRHQAEEAFYFSVVNRWPLSALLMDEERQALVELFTPIIAEMHGRPLQALEMDVLYKSPYASAATPCHQDIAYAYQKPYLLSTWLALTDVTEQDSPLQFLPGSHFSPIMPAIDFWQPDFIDTMRMSPAWRHQAITVPAAAGDAVMFSSRIWHGSVTHQSKQTRLALVMRWGGESIVYGPIPLPEKTLFGMWNCGRYTAELLQNGLEKIFNIKKTDLTGIIQEWQKQLSHASLPFIYDKKRAFNSLEKLLLLNTAYTWYGGGDNQGVVYAQLWKDFLCALNEYLHEKFN